MNFLENAIATVYLATEEDNKGNYEEAFKLYIKSIDYFHAALKCMSHFPSFMMH